ncbi:hypothetical protein BDQ12DRAFT_120392 [Crucibulum laeve]|uniref:PH domain-containing protein n=1 Tax=Crucibulum laeve TaxID=68775 RepID=A0A5C3LYY7_9AGAR|nr:hypothetical protein BDQ12DRAFT_120392 [Crucibulum laeve]
MEQPRAQSALPPRTPKSTRSNKLFSSFKGIIRLPVRKQSKDDTHPYSRQTGNKPYMSQPMLGLSNPTGDHYQHTDHYGEDSSSSPEPSPSQSEDGTRIPQPASVQRSHKRGGSERSISNGLLPSLQTGLSLGRLRGGSIDGPPASQQRPHPAIRADNASSPPVPPKHNGLPIPQKRATGTKLIPQTNTESIPRNTRTPAPILKLTDPSPTPPPSATKLSRPPPSSFTAPPAPSVISTSSSMPSISTRPVTNTYDSTSAMGPLAPNSIQRSTGEGFAAGKRPVPAPKLTLPPPNHRFSLTMNDWSGSARLSPSIIMRPPPLPLQIPMLPVVTPREPSPPLTGSRQRRHLNSMPALPLQGTSRSVNEHEEVDEGDEDDDDDDEDGTPEVELEEEDTIPRSSMDSEMSERESMVDQTLSRTPSRTPSRSSSYHTAFSVPDVKTPEGSTAHHRHHPKPERIGVGLLPDVDTSRIDLSFLDRPPDLKGKAKAKYEPARIGPSLTRTPTSTRPSIITNVSWNASNDNDYFSSRTTVDTPASDRTPHPGTNHASPTRTPRPGDVLRTPLPLRTPDLLGLGTGNGTPSRHPGMYKRASRSLIDIHAVEKRERVEKMVIEEEEEMEKKRMSKRFSKQPTVKEGLISGDQGMQLQQTAAEEDGEMMPRQKRLSAAPAYEAPSHPLKRRRSMPTFNPATLPPPYPSFFPRTFEKILPREDEGKERLPSYSNSIYLKAIMPRKVEFTAPGVQAKDRKWRRVMCVLEGTMFRVYQVPAGVAGVSALGGWWERKVGVGDVSEDQGAETTRVQNARDVIRRRQEEREAELERARKDDETQEGREQVEVRLSAPLPAPGSSSASGSHPYQHHTQEHHSHLLPGAATKSALNLAVQLLKPSSRTHTRSNSDVPRSPTKPHSPRASLNIPRPTTPASSGTGHGSTGGSRPSSSMSVSVPSSAGSSSLSPPNSGSRYSSSSLSTPITSSSSRSQPRTGSSTASVRTPTSGKSAKDALPEPNPANLIKVYTMQNAESGLGNDYLKRANVIRVRMEGEQFLLQAKDVASVVEWIEVREIS